MSSASPRGGSPSRIDELGDAFAEIAVTDVVAPFEHILPAVQFERVAGRTMKASRTRDDALGVAVNFGLALVAHDVRGAPTIEHEVYRRSRAMANRVRDRLADDHTKLHAMHVTPDHPHREPPLSVVD